MTTDQQTARVRLTVAARTLTSDPNMVDALDRRSIRAYEEFEAALNAVLDQPDERARLALRLLAADRRVARWQSDTFDGDGKPWSDGELADLLLTAAGG